MRAEFRSDEELAARGREIAERIRERDCRMRRDWWAGAWGWTWRLGICYVLICALWYVALYSARCGS